MDTEAVRQHVVRVINDAVTTDAENRATFLAEFLSVVSPTTLDGPVARWCHHIPTLMPGLYQKWANMYAERLLETIPQNQLELLCNGDAENDAALKLAFVMFMESERMEQQIPKDLAASAADIESPEQQLLLETIACALASRLRRQ